MAITAGMVKELRELSGAGMMDCKKALTETDGNMEEAIELLRKKGQAKQEKKAGRVTAEGLCEIAINGDEAAIVEVNSETDFVARNEEFKKYVTKVAKQALSSNAADIDAFMSESWLEDSQKSVNDALADQIAVIGENLTIRRFKKVKAQNGALVSYIHGGGRIGVVLSAKCENKSDVVIEALNNIAMQIAAMSPKYISEAEVDAAYLEHEKEIILAQINNDPNESAKPDKVKEGMVKGRINKQLKEICLLDQVYVKAEDGKENVAKYLERVSKEAGCTVTLEEFVRFETGEGIEKREENFAEEVAKQMQ